MRLPTGRRRALARSHGPTRPAVLGAIAVGGVLGASARYGIARALPTPAGAFPWATFWTNVSGSFVLGVFLVLAVERFGPARLLRAFFATGVVGAFTTFSTFAVETDVRLKDGHVLTALAYVAATLVAGLTAAWLGATAGRLVGRPSGAP